MILNIMGFNNCLDFNISKINIIEVFDKKLFINFYIDIQNFMFDNNYHGQFTLIENEECISMSNNILCVQDIFNYSLNTKHIINKIYNILNDKLNLNEELKFKLNNKINELNSLVPQCLDDIDINLSWENNIEAIDYLKFLKINVEEPLCDSLLNRLLNIIDVISELKMYKLIVFFNLKCFLLEEELIEFYKYCNYRDVNILLIENKFDKKLKYEHKLIIDESYDDYLI